MRDRVGGRSLVLLGAEEGTAAPGPWGTQGSDIVAPLSEEEDVRNQFPPGIRRVTPEITQGIPRVRPGLLVQRSLVGTLRLTLWANSHDTLCKMTPTEAGWS